MCFAEMYIPEPTNIPIEKTNHRGRNQHDFPHWPTPSENDIHHHRGKDPVQFTLFSPRCIYQ